MLFTIILYVVTAILLILSLVKSKEKTKLALKKAWKAFENILPQFLSILIIIGIVLSILDAETISNLIGKDSGWIGMIILGVVGAITLVPGFIAFPLAASLLRSGAGYMQIAAFISTLMMVGVVTMPLEIKYFGKKMTFIRNGLAFIFSFGIAIVIGAVLG
jgi:uncharacterized membrane protein YraQ (UPF0718 family)